MALHLVADREPLSWTGVTTLVEVEGSAVHDHVRRLCAADRRGPTDRRGSDRGDRRAAAPELAATHGSMARRVDLADAVHALCAVHGAHRGLADQARQHPAAGAAAAWLGQVAAALADERGHLARTVSASGRLPSTPGQAASDAALGVQRNAFHLLARSDRVGVATGAAAALALDWTAIRAVIGRAAEAYGLTLPAPSLPTAEETAGVLDRIDDGAAVRRAVLFGARALLDQHRALWSLLEARAYARMV
ncbi:DUF6975 family protein [uncultured Sphingomonas sp.]|uniref:DUF6975 family protein n=1 Tax=uncultured Sphingomonas sp. TaxID=158754 RepID=UPI0035CA6052